MIFKFETKESINTKGEAIRFAQQCEQISDDFAVKFAEWIVNLNETNNVLIYEKKKAELLQIFKNNFYE